MTKKTIQFVLETPKVVGDPLHGYIPLTNLEYSLLQLPTMNRLHYLRQTQTAYLTFPGSVSTRFSHVVGALHIGHKMISQLLSTITPKIFLELFPTVGGNVETIIKTVRLACLFHDVGHGPFSHAGEDAMVKVMQKIDYKRISEAEQLFQDKIDKIPIHEYYSYKLVTDGEIKDEIIHHEGKSLVKSVSSLLVKTNELGFTKNNPQGSRILRKIVSSQLDADRMDYLLRDSMMSGVQFGQVDIDRIIQNMAIMKEGTGVYQIAFHERAIGNIEDMLDARFKMYRWFYNHHTLMATNELMKKAIDLMIGEDDEVAKLFHWSEYHKGLSTDDNVLAKLREKIENTKNLEYLKFKGLIDRRYLPVSLFKATPDMGRVVEQIKKNMKTKTSNDMIISKMTTFFEKGESKLKAKLSQHGGELKNCLIFQTRLQMKPYKYFEEKEEDLIFLYRKQMDDLCELYEESGYFKSINTQWTHFKTLYVFYLIPGKMKQSVKKYEKDVTDILATEIANF